MKTRIATIYGGQSFDPQIKALKKGADIVVGTPGRVLDMIKKGYLKIKNIHILVLDEADEMLRFGFIDELESIFSYATELKRTLLFSATIPPEILSLSSRYMTNPHQISVKRNKEDTSNIHQSYIHVASHSKVDLVQRLIDIEPHFYGFIFCNTKRQAEEIGITLAKQGYACDSLHGDLTQAAREKVLLKFRHRFIKILVVTDVVARGIDIEKLTHVINISPPFDVESYIHRIGRTGRGGESGKAITLVSPSEQRLLKSIERRFKNSLVEDTPPSSEKIVQAKKEGVLETIKEKLNTPRNDTHMNIAKTLLENHDPMDVLSAVLDLWKGNIFEESRYSKIHIGSQKKDHKKTNFFKKRKHSHSTHSPNKKKYKRYSN